MVDLDDPIVAIATASGRGAIGIVRVSGHALEGLIDAICGRALEPRQATHLAFRAADGTTLDRGLAIFFPAPHSYTGESVLELQAHGGPVVLQLLVARCLEASAEIDPSTARERLPRLRPARPGEFTERAFLNDKIDLAQAEAVSDLIEASTEAAARSASRSLAGAFSNEINALRDHLIELRALVEATLDFPDEEIDFLENANAFGRLDALDAHLASVLGRARQGALLRDGMRVVLAGQPNVGKSSLLNALAGAELAIVSRVAGTTRDKVGETIQIRGVPVHVVDTAGLRESSDEIEQLGIARTWGAIEDADAIVFLHDLTRVGEATYDAADAAIARQLDQDALARDVAPTPRVQQHVIHAYNKADVAQRADGDTGLAISAVTGQGLDALRDALLDRAGWHALAEGVFIARTRHVHALQRARAHLESARGHARRGDVSLELLAEDLRLAHDALGEITGAFSVDALLGVIFGSFCIGK